MAYFLETPRLIMREMQAEDVQGMFALDANVEVHRYLGNKPITSIKEAKKIIESVQKQYQERGIGRWSVIEKKSKQFIGWSGIRLNTEYQMNGFTTYYDIGYRLIPKFWGKGYATESAKEALKYAFNTLQLPEIYATTHVKNQASHKVLLKIGLQYKENFYFEEEQLPLRWYALKKEDYGR